MCGNQSGVSKWKTLRLLLEVILLFQAVGRLESNLLCFEFLYGGIDGLKSDTHV